MFLLLQKFRQLLQWQQGLGVTDLDRGPPVESKKRREDSNTGIRRMLTKTDGHEL
jgi:hypothetical protein